MTRNGRNRTIGYYNLDLLPDDCLTANGMPIIWPCKTIPPDDLIGFNYAKGTATKQVTRLGCHFYLDDYQFERCWQNPIKYGQMLSKFQCVLTPDFSLYRDMPLPMQRWNYYRSRLIGMVWQRMGLSVIPSAQWSSPDSYDFAFDGLPSHSVISVSSVGVLGDQEATRLWKHGFRVMEDLLSPSLILLYGKIPDGFKITTKHVQYTNHNTRRLKQWEAEAQTAQGENQDQEAAQR